MDGKNRRLAMVLFSVGEIIVYSALFAILHLPIGFIIVFDLLLIFLNYAGVDGSHTILMKEPIRMMNENCDPIPLFEETRKLLTYKNSEVNRQVILINHCVALRNMGEYQKVFDILSSINIDKFPGMLPINKFVYYNNLADICAILGKMEEANIWSAKMLQLYADIKESKMKRAYEHMVLSAKANNYFFCGEFEKTIEILNGMKDTCLKNQVDNALLYAQTYLKLNDLAKAKEKLEFVIRKGNRLYAVTEARELLNQLSGESRSEPNN